MCYHDFPPSALPTPAPAPCLLLLLIKRQDSLESQIFATAHVLCMPPPFLHGVRLMLIYNSLCIPALTHGHLQLMSHSLCIPASLWATTGRVVCRLSPLFGGVTWLPSCPKARNTCFILVRLRPLHFPPPHLTPPNSSPNLHLQTPPLNSSSKRLLAACEQGHDAHVVAPCLTCLAGLCALLACFFEWVCVFSA